MSRAPFLAFLLAFVSLSHICHAQLPKNKIVEYLKTSSFPIDTDAGAIVLFEREKIEIYRVNGHIQSTRDICATIKINKTSAFKLANLYFFRDKANYNNYTYKVTGTTYNLVDNEVKESSLPKQDLYKTKVEKDIYKISTAMPDVREGCIIDYHLKITSPFYATLPTWKIQDDYPKLYTEYSISYPQEIEFNALLHTLSDPKEYKSEADAIKAPENFCVYINTTGFTFGNFYTMWVRKNVPAAAKEPYIWNLHNHKERVDFQMTKYLINDYLYLNSWNKYNENLWKSELAKDIRRPNNFLDATVKNIVKNDTNKLAIAKAIFNYVKTHYTSNKFTPKQRRDLLEPDRGIKSTFNQGHGTATQVNALLAAMLNNAGLNAYILVTGTTNNIPASALYPIYGRLDYFACAVAINGTNILLDANDVNNAFNMLPFECYNGYSRIISEEGAALDLNPNNLIDKNIHSVKISMINDSTQKVEYTRKIGLVSSVDLRKRFAKSEKSPDNWVEEQIMAIDEMATIKEQKIENLHEADTNLIIRVVYVTRMPHNGNSVLYNPMLLKTIPKNPFTAPQRNYAIEFPCRINDAYHINFELPDGYKIDSVPKSVTIALDDNTIEYRKYVGYYPVTNTLSVNTTYEVNEAIHAKTEYKPISKLYEDIINEEKKVIEITHQ